MVFQKRTKENREEQKEAKKMQKLKFKERIKNFIKNKKAVAMVIEYILTIECFTMLFLLTTPIETKAATFTDGEGIKWNYTVSSGQATNVYIEGGTITSTTLEIPRNFRGIGGSSAYPVVSLRNSAFSNASGYKNITNIKIPSSVTSIEWNVFSGCTNLTEIEVDANNSIYSSEEGILYNRDKTTLIKCPEGRKKESIEIPSSVTNIENRAFQSCTGLTSIEIPSSVTSIGINAFQNCSGLTSIEIPESVTSIGQYAFSGCIGLTSIEIPNSVTSIGEFVFSGCTGLTSIEIPESVTSIGRYAFSGCTGLTSIEIPSGVKGIGESVFSGCTGLTSIEIPDSVRSIGSNAFYCCSGLTSIEIPSSVTSIGINAFQNCSGLTSIEIPESVTSIGQYAFSGCTGLTSIEIPSSVTSIGINAFQNCSGLTSIEIPSSVTSIGINAFQNCSGLTSIEIPESVTSIERMAFSGCTGLTNIIVNEGNQIYSSEEGILYNKEKTKLILYPCGKIGEVIIRNNVTSIGSYAFANWYELRDITIPNSVTSIENYAFEGCTGLTKITMPGTASLGLYAFYNVTNIEEVILTGEGAMPNYTNSTYQYTPWYRSRNNIKSITIRDGISRIGDYAFYNSTGLQDIYVNKLQSAISFGTNWNSNCYAYVHYSDCTNTISFSLAEGISIESLTNNITDGKINCRDSYSFRIINNNGNKVILKSEGLRTNEPVISKTLIPDEEGVYTINNIKRNIEIIAGEQTNGDLYEAIDENGIKWGYTYQNGEATDVYYRDGTIGEKIIVPSYLEGLKVVSVGRNKAQYNILNSTSNNSIVKEIVLPNTVNSIGNYAFYTLTTLTDIYIDKYESEITFGTDWNSSCYAYIHYKECKHTVDKDNDINEKVNFEDITNNLINNKIECNGTYKFRLTDESGNVVYNKTITIVSQGLRTNSNNVTKELLPNEEGIYTIENINRNITICTGKINGNKYEAKDNNEITWEYTYKDSKAEDVKYKSGLLGEVVSIPEYLDGYPVTSLAMNHFESASSGNGFTGGYYNIFNEKTVRLIKKIILPNTLITIKDHVFCNCTSLRSIEIPNSVTSIEYSAFSGCTGLTSIEIPNSVISLNGFSGCTGLTSIEIPNSVTSIESGAFSGCTGLTSIEIPNSVISLNGFSGCTGLTSIEIPNSVTSIGEGAFSNCTGLTSIEIPNNVISLSGFSGCTGLTVIEIPSSVTSIGRSAFSNCTGLTSIEIPSSVTSIGGYAFYQCTGLTEIEIPDSVTGIENYTFSYCRGLTRVTIGSSVTSIGEFAFSGCTGLTNIEIPDSVLNIEGNAFSNCRGLTRVTIGSSVTSIGYSAFNECTGLTSIEIPSSVTSIGNYAFQNCTKLTKIIMPGTVSLSQYTFNNVTNVEEVYLTGEGEMPNYTSSTYTYTPWYQSRNKIQKIIIGDKITRIGNYAFYNCTSLMDIYVDRLQSEITLGTNWSNNCYAYVHYSDCTHTITTLIPQGIIIENVTDNVTDEKIKCGESYSFKIINNNEENKVILKTDGLRSNEVSIYKIITPDKNGIYTLNNINRNTEIIVGNPSNGQQYQSEDENGIKWSYTYEDNKATNVYYSLGTLSETLTIPAYLDGIQVISIGRNNGSNNILNTTLSNTSITEIILPDTLERIGSYAFYNCTGLTDIYIDRLQTEITLDTNWNSNCYAYVHYSDCLHTITTSIPQGIIIENVTDNLIDGKIECGESYSFKLVNESGIIPRNIRKVTITSQGLKTNAGNTTEVISPNEEGIYTIENINRNKTITVVSYVNGTTYQVTDSNGITWSYTYQNDVATNVYKTGGTLTSTLTIPSYLDSAKVVSIGRNNGSSNNILNTTSSNSTITKVILPETLETIGNYTFYYFIGLTNIEIPNGVTRIGDSAFNNCTALTQIGIPSSVTSIGNCAFNYCSKLTDIYVDNEQKDVNFVQYWDGQNNTYAYVHYKNHTHNINIEVEEGLHIEEIEGSIENNNIVCQSEYKFRLLDEENNVVINKPVIMEKSLKIEKRMPWGSVNTKDLPREAKRLIPDEEGVYTIEDIDTVRNISIKVGLVNGVVDEWTDSNGITWSYTFENKQARGLKYISGDLSNIDILEVPEKINGFVVISLADEAFKGLELKKVILPDSIINIGKEAFSGCTTLEEVVLPVDLTFISDYAFSGCTSLGEMELPEKLEVIGNYAFQNCTSLSIDLTLKSGMKTIGQNAFSGCSSLEGEIVLPSGFVQISNGAFTNCSGITGIRMSKYTGEEPIDQLVVNFKQGVSLNTITEDTRKYAQIGIEKSVLAEKDDFGNILNLILDENGKPIVTVSKIINIGSGAFSGCTSLTKVYLPEETKILHCDSGLGFSNILDIYVDINKAAVTEDISSSALNEVNVHYKGDKHSVEFTGKALNEGYSIETIEGSIDSKGKIACKSVYRFKVLDGNSTSVTDVQVRTKKPAQDISDARTLTANEDGIYTVTVKSDIEIIIGTGNGDTFTEEVDGITWSYTYENGKATNVYYKSGSLGGSVTIPSHLNELPVVSIYNKDQGNNGYNIFGQYMYNTTSVTEVILPETLEEIGNYALAGCRNITNITIPNGVKRIGENAFYYCSGLTGSINLSNNIVYIGNGVFYSCNNITDIYINNNERNVKIGGNRGVFNIHYLDHKHSITINNDPREKVIVETVDGNLEDGQILCKATYKFRLLNEQGEIVKDKTIKIQNQTITVMPWGSTQVDIVTEELNPDEEGIYTIETIVRDYIICTGAVNGETKTFEDEQGITWQYTYEDEKARALKYVSGDLSEIETLEVPDKVDGLIVTTLADEALKGQTSLKNVVFPDSITNIGQSAFEGCTSLETAVLPDELEIISTSAFKGCSNLLTVELPDSLIAIGDEAFSGCNNLSMDLSIKNGLKVIGKESFKDCTSLTGELVLPETLSQIGTEAFSGCSSITKVIIMPYTGTQRVDKGNIGYSGNISFNLSEMSGENAISNISAINITNAVSDEKDEFGNNITLVDEYGMPIKVYVRTVKIGQNAFSGCTALEEMDVQAKVDAVDGNIISECPNLKDVYIASKSTEMDALNVPEGVTVHYLDSIQEVEIEAVEGAIIEVISGADEEGNAYCQSDYKFKVNIAKGSSYKGVVVKVGNKGEEKEVIKPDEDGIYTITRVLKDQEIEIIEGRTVEIKYVDNSGKEIAKSKIIAGLEGESYTTQSKEIQYYKWNGAIPENAEGVYTEEDIIVIYVYDNLPSGIITVKYIDKDGKEISEKETVQGYQGDTYEILRKNIKGYKAYGVTPENAKGMFTEEDVEVIFVYEAIEEDIVVKYVDEEGNYIARDKTVYDKEEIEAKDIDGYKNTGKEKDGKEITYTYEDTRNRSSKWTTEQTLLVIAGIIIVLTVVFIIIARREKKNNIE